MLNKKQPKQVNYDDFCDLNVIDINQHKSIITPEIAKSMLERNTKNFRKIKESSIRNYARDMESGNWSLSHQGISFDKDGVLHDGQNRLYACIKSGVPFETLVFKNCDGKLSFNVDVGPRRNVADWLRQNGYKNCTQLASALKLYYAVKHEKEPHSVRLTPNEQITILEENPRIVDFFNYCKILDGAVRPSCPAVVLYVSVMENGTPENIADDFVDTFYTGSMFGDPRFSLREAISYRRQKLRKMEVFPVKYELAMTIKCWNAFKAGVPLSKKQVNWNDRQQFPRIK